MKRKNIVWTSLMMMGVCGFASAESSEKPEVGNLYPFLNAYAGQHEPCLSYLAHDWPEVEQWRIRGRAKMQEILAYEPEAMPRNPEVVESVQKAGYMRHKVRYNVTPDCRTEAFLLIPDKLDRPAPAVIALHDHGGFYYYGKEKITETEIPSPYLRQHIENAYAGRPYADELARRGFVVLVPDAFYFGARRLDPEAMPKELSEALRSCTPGSDEAIRAFNALAGKHEPTVAKAIFNAGTTWAGILFQGDRASVDYLLSRPEVDPQKVGCVGLSIGGYRSAHLFGLDPRIKAGVVVCWMTTYNALLYDRLLHTWMVFVPGQTNYLDLPDVVTLNAPNPLMVINCAQDLVLFNMEGMKAAENKIAQVYRKMNAADRFACNWYDEPHSFKRPAQEAAINWLEKWLKRD